MRNSLGSDLKSFPQTSRSSVLKMITSGKIGRILIGFSLLGAVGIGINKHKKKEIPISPAKESINFKYDESPCIIWDNNNEFFLKGYAPRKELYTVTDPTSHKTIKIKIIHDAGLDFYKVTKDDVIVEKIHTGKFRLIHAKAKKSKKRGKQAITAARKEEIINTRKTLDFSRIISKLSQLDRFGYLKRKEYDRLNPYNKTLSFNIGKKDGVKENMLLPIPLDSGQRQINDLKFAYYSKKAIDEMLGNESYSEKTKEMLELVGGEKNMVAIMVAFARSETSEDYKYFTQKIGYNELHRWEERYRSFSFTYYHILMNGPGFKARKKLCLTEGQCYHPQNAGMLFIGYWIEKTDGDLSKYFPLDTPEKIRKAGAVFNGSNEYAPKFKANYYYSKKLLGV